MRKNSRGPSARRGVRRGNDEYPGWKVSTPTAPLEGRKCLDENKMQNKYNTQDMKDNTQTRTLVAPRLWAEGGVGKAKLNNEEKATALRMRYRCFIQPLTRH